MKAVTPESLWHVFIMFWALPYFFTQHNVGAHLVPPSSGPGLGPFPRVLAPFREERYLATKIYTLGALISTGMLLPSGCQWTHLGIALGREAVPLRFCASKLIEIHPISTWHHTFILVFSLPVIVIPFSEVRNLASMICYPFTLLFSWEILLYHYRHTCHTPTENNVTDYITILPCHSFCLIQFSSVAQSCPILCEPMDCSTPGFPIHHQLQELA